MFDIIHIIIVFYCMVNALRKAKFYDGDEFHHIDGGEYGAVESNDVELRTGGLFTCTALAFVSKERHVLTHIQPQDDVADFLSDLKRWFDFENDPPKVKMISGAQAIGEMDYSVRIARNVLHHLGVQNFECSTCDNFMNEVVIAPSGDVSIGEKRRHQHEFIERDGVTYVFMSNAEASNIEELEDGRILHHIDVAGRITTKTHENCIVAECDRRGYGYEGLVGIFRLAYPDEIMQAKGRTPRDVGQVPASEHAEIIDIDSFRDCTAA